MQYKNSYKSTQLHHFRINRELSKSTVRNFHNIIKYVAAMTSLELLVIHRDCQKETDDVRWATVSHAYLLKYVTSSWVKPVISSKFDTLPTLCLERQYMWICCCRIWRARLTLSHLPDSRHQFTAAPEANDQLDWQWQSYRKSSFKYHILNYSKNHSTETATSVVTCLVRHASGSWCSANYVSLSVTIHCHLATALWSVYCMLLCLTASTPS